ncbi:MAG: hypothetical protein ACFFAH_02095 [Promethearchaeota archaeon]
MRLEDILKGGEKIVREGARVTKDIFDKTFKVATESSKKAIGGLEKILKGK